MRATDMEKQRANAVDVEAKALFYGEVSIDNGRIVAIDVLGDVQPSQPYLLPSFVDAHVHNNIRTAATISGQPLVSKNET